MTFEVELRGRTRTVVIERTDRPGWFRVLVDGHPHLLDVIRTSEFGLSLLLRAATNSGNRGTVTFSPVSGPEKGTVPESEPLAAPISRDLHVTPAGSYGELLVTLQGRTATVLVNGRRTGHAADAASHGHGEISITAPMPGRVVRVLVVPGEEISPRQGIVVVEAMKMENELRAPRAGRVKEVAVEPGTSVEAGRVLAVIE